MYLFAKIFRLRQRAATASAVAVVTLAAMTTLAAAQDTGAYGRIYGGLASVQDMNFADPATADMELDSGSGLTFGGALGYRFGSGFRAELDVAHTSVDMDGVLTENVQAFIPCGETPSNPCLDPDIDGDYNGLSGMAMAYYEFSTGSALTPYIGVGIGLVDVDLEAETIGNLNDGTSSEFAILDGSDSEFAYRLAAGLAYDIGAFDLTADYAYTRTGRVALDGRSAYTTFTFDRRAEVHAFTVGARLSF